MKLEISKERTLESISKEIVRLQIEKNDYMLGLMINHYCNHLTLYVHLGYDIKSYLELKGTRL